MDSPRKVDIGPLLPGMGDTMKRLGSAVADFMDRLRSTMTQVGNMIMRGMTNIAEVANAADTIATRFRWCISTSWPADLIFDIAQMADADRPFHEFEERMMTFYRENSWEEIEKLVLATCSYESVAPNRRRVLLDTVTLLRAADRDGFNAASFAIPALFAELEGLLRDFATEGLGLVDGPGKSITVRQMMKPLEAVASRIERPACEVITRLLFASYRDKVPPVGMRFNRHYYNHGRSQAPARVSRVVRLLLMIDLIAYLIDLNRGSESPAVRLRATWGILLSGFSDFGELNQTLAYTRPTEKHLMLPVLPVFTREERPKTQPPPSLF